MKMFSYYHGTMYLFFIMGRLFFTSSVFELIVLEGVNLCMHQSCRIFKRGTLQEKPSTSKGDKATGVHHFSRMYEDLPSCLSKNMAENLSVPLAFVSLLHLANEKVCLLFFKSFNDF